MSAPRLLAYVLPYWRSLILIVSLSLLGTAFSLFLPYLSKLLIDRALIGRDWMAFVQTVALFAGHRRKFRAQRD